MKVLILGGLGMLGHKLWQSLYAQWQNAIVRLRFPLDDCRFAYVRILVSPAMIGDNGAHALEWTPFCREN